MAQKKLPMFKMIGLIRLYESFTLERKLIDKVDMNGLWHIVVLDKLDTDHPKATLERRVTWDDVGPLGQKITLPYEFVCEFFERKEIVGKPAPKT